MSPQHIRHYFQVLDFYVIIKNYFSLELYHNQRLSLIDVLKLVTSSPANLMNLPGGRFQKGFPADLILLNPDRGRQINDQTLQSKSKNTPFDGRPVQGEVLRTVVNGETVFQAKTDHL